MNWTVRIDSTQPPDPDFPGERESLVCTDCKELVVLGAVGMTCGCGEKIRFDSLGGRDPYKRFPHQRSTAPIDKYQVSMKPVKL